MVELGHAFSAVLAVSSGGMPLGFAGRTHRFDIVHTVKVLNRSYKQVLPYNRLDVARVYVGNPEVKEGIDSH